MEVDQEEVEEEEEDQNITQQVNFEQQNTKQVDEEMLPYFNEKVQDDRVSFGEESKQ